MNQMVECHLSEDSKQSRDLMMTVCTAAAAANMLLGLCKMKERGVREDKNVKMYVCAKP